jgi:glycine/D-amino acid oxidase-like deaminating enzyme
MRCDIAVIGGGVNGFAIARELSARFGADVALFEDPRRRPATLSAAGMLGAQIESARRAGPERVAFFLALQKSQVLHEMLDLHLRDRVGFSTGLRANGALHVTHDERALEALEARYLWQREHGAEVVPVTCDEARQLEPVLGPDVVGGVYLPDEKTVDPVALLGVLGAACRDLGVRVVGGRVRRLVCASDQVCGLETEVGPWGADVVVVAAGAWSSVLAGLPPNAATFQPERAQSLLVRNVTPPLQRIIVGAEGYLSPRSDGHVAFGATSDVDLHEDSLAALRSVAWLAPKLASQPIERVQVAHRMHTPDGLPYVGTTEIEGLLLATGNVANGLLLAPLCAQMVADAVAELRQPRPARYATQYSAAGPELAGPDLSPTPAH